MKLFSKILSLALSLGVPVASFAQQGIPNVTPSFTQTTLAAAMTITDTCFTVASGTGFSVGKFVMIDEEQMGPIRSVATARVCAYRNGQFVAPHGSGRAVLVADGPNFSACAVTNGCGALANSAYKTKFSTSQFFPTIFPVATAGATTLTSGQVLNGYVTNDPGGAISVTLPTAELLLSSLPGATLGTTIRLVIRNISSGANTITIAAGTGGTFGATGGTATIAQFNEKAIDIRFTGVVPGAASYQVYSRGTYVF